MVLLLFKFCIGFLCLNRGINRASRNIMASGVQNGKQKSKNEEPKAKSNYLLIAKRLEAM